MSQNIVYLSMYADVLILRIFSDVSLESGQPGCYGILEYIPRWTIAEKKKICTRPFRKVHAAAKKTRPVSGDHGLFV